ncbi:MAG: CerR family C-terminal domain-containing protein [Deltaproteobacteria bacterium]|nr:CerR family C-terminal domain-containing protein [Deltaproteobacteria bacterium]MBW2116664.1 CerR family C-terminal domain-containing protein [Deltaproteobacteria bacterium]MBW2343227.1 CerR family C-terminal domain-containing protein [Deltaproteobacteria bacterium]
MVQKDKNEFPRERILDEAELLFARKGYHAVTVREITTRAGCNLAAVNYHFGNKENLYLEVFKTRWFPRARRIMNAVDKALESRERISISAVIHAVASAFLEGPLTERERELHFQLMVRELAQPTEAFEIVAGQIMQPFFQKLGAIISPFLPGKMDEEQLMLSMFSVFSMILHLNFARVAVTRLTGREYDAAFRARLVGHIVEFSLNGLGGIYREESE